MTDEGFSFNERALRYYVEEVFSTAEQDLFVADDRWFLRYDSALARAVSRVIEFLAPIRPDRSQLENPGSCTEISPQTARGIRAYIRREQSVYNETFAGRLPLVTLAWDEAKD